jgi:hypothetical protein
MNKSFKELSSLPIKHRPTAFLVSRDLEFVEQHKETHMTLAQAASRMGICRQKAVDLLPPHDIRSKYGKKTRLWRRDVVVDLLTRNAI